jgi:hypothetical protein
METIVLTMLASKDNVVTQIELASLGGKAAAKNLTAQERSQRARKASLARWKKWRKAKRQRNRQAR